MEENEKKPPYSQQSNWFSFTIGDHRWSWPPAEDGKEVAMSGVTPPFLAPFLDRVLARYYIEIKYFIFI
jgi:hypothetical protein